MTNKVKAQERGVKVINSQDALVRMKNEKTQELKKLISSCINSDNQIDIQALQKLIDTAQKISHDKGYELTFAGKGVAISKADEPCTKQLKVEWNQSKNFENTNNVLIRGDNLDVLKILYQNYHAQIKMIYIDPPYNTKNDSFVYHDNFKQTEDQLIQELNLHKKTIDFLDHVYATKSHSGWLAFIYPRLKLARELLKEDGAIFISIDDHEQANLKILCDEIFGIENFVASFIWQTKKNAQGMTTVNLIASNHEYILVYAKNVSCFKFHGIEREKAEFQNPDHDARGLWKRQYLQRFGQNLPKRKIVNPQTNYVYEFETPYTQEKLDEWVKDGTIFFQPNDKGYPVRKEFLSSYQNNIQLMTSLGLFSTKSYTEKLYSLFHKKKIFNNPKPDDLIKFLIDQSTDDHDIILDFFAGSGTTGDAIMQLNLEKKNHRKFILVQSDEEIHQKTEAYQFCLENNLKPVIANLTIERLHRAGDKLQKKQQSQQGVSHDINLDIGYKVFSLKEKIKITEQKDQKNLFVLEESEHNLLDTLINMLCATCKKLDSQIQEIIQEKLYQVDDEIYMVSEVSMTDLEPYRDFKININGWGDINLENWLNLGVLDDKNITIVY